MGRGKGGFISAGTDCVDIMRHLIPDVFDISFFAQSPAGRILIEIIDIINAVIQKGDQFHQRLMQPIVIFEIIIQENIHFADVIGKVRPGFTKRVRSHIVILLDIFPLCYFIVAFPFILFGQFCIDILQLFVELFVSLFKIVGLLVKSFLFLIETSFLSLDLRSSFAKIFFGFGTLFVDLILGFKDLFLFDGFRL